MWFKQQKFETPGSESQNLLNTALENNHRCFGGTLEQRSNIIERLRVSVMETRGRMTERLHASSSACLSYPPSSVRASQRQTRSTAVELGISGAAHRCSARCMCFSGKRTFPFSKQRSHNRFSVIPVTPKEKTTKRLCKDYLKSASFCIVLADFNTYRKGMEHRAAREFMFEQAPMFYQDMFCIFIRNLLRMMRQKLCHVAVKFGNRN